MTTSDASIKLIEQFEGLRLTAYQDVRGIWTIGYGHTGKDVHPGITITRAQAELLLRQGLKTVENAVSRLVTRPLTQSQFDALVSFTFNLGQGNLESSTLLRDVNAGQITHADEQFVYWDHAGGKEIEGLRERRTAEARLFAS